MSSESSPQNRSRSIWFSPGASSTVTTSSEEEYRRLCLIDNDCDDTVMIVSDDDGDDKSLIDADEVRDTSDICKSEGDMDIDALEDSKAQQQYTPIEASSQQSLAGYIPVTGLCDSSIDVGDSGPSTTTQTSVPARNEIPDSAYDSTFPSHTSTDTSTDLICSEFNDEENNSSGPLTRPSQGHNEQHATTRIPFFRLSHSNDDNDDANEALVSSTVRELVDDNVSTHVDKNDKDLKVVHAIESSSVDEDGNEHYDDTHDSVEPESPKTKAKSLLRVSLFKKLSKDKAAKKPINKQDDTMHNKLAIKKQKRLAEGIVKDANTDGDTEAVRKSADLPSAGEQPVLARHSNETNSSQKTKKQMPAVKSTKCNSISPEADYFKSLRGTALSRLQYHLFRDFLGDQHTLPSLQLLRASNLAVEAKNTSRWAKFRAWAKRMTLRKEDGELVIERTNKIIVPSEDWITTLRKINRADSPVNHLTTTYTLNKLRQNYAMGLRQFGMTEEFVRHVLSTCDNVFCPCTRPKVSLGTAPSIAEINHKLILPKLHVPATRTLSTATRTKATTPSGSIDRDANKSSSLAAQSASNAKGQSQSPFPRKRQTQSVYLVTVDPVTKRERLIKATVDMSTKQSPGVIQAQVDMSMLLKQADQQPITPGDKLCDTSSNNKIKAVSGSKSASKRSVNTTSHEAGVEEQTPSTNGPAKLYVLKATEASSSSLVKDLPVDTQQSSLVSTSTSNSSVVYNLFPALKPIEPPILFPDVWYFKQEIENQTNCYDQLLIVLKDIRLDTTHAFLSSRSATEKLKRKLMFADCLVKHCKSWVLGRLNMLTALEKLVVGVPPSPPAAEELKKSKS